MELDWIWKAILIVVVGTLLLRIAGRKSISQMTLPQTVIMIAIGSLLVQPVADNNIWITFGVGGILILTLIAMEYAELKGDGFETLITGKSKVIIENGTLNEKNLRKLRLTVDQLEMKLRQQNIVRISDVQYATLEPNGQLGYTLKQEAQSATRKEIQQLHADLKALQQTVDQLIPTASSVSLNSNQQPSQENLFKEVDKKSHNNSPPDYLQ